jgi:DNA-binding transcriptional regulator GbsR (MarR family)
MFVILDKPMIVKPTTSLECDPQALSRFVESFAAVLTEAGFPRMPARVFGALLASDSGTMTSMELADLLRVSPAAISGGVRYLMQINLVSREHEPGSRRDRYRVHNDAWYEAMARRDRVLSRCEHSLREGIELFGRDTGAGARMAETLAFFEFIQSQLHMLLVRWRERKKTLNFANAKGGSRGARR